MNFFRRAENIFAATALICFFIPWANIAGFMSFSAFDLPRVVQGLAQVKNAFEKTPTATDAKVYLPYLLYIIPAISIGIFIAWANRLHAHTRLLSIYGGAVISVGLIGGLLYLQSSASVDDKFRPTDVISVGYYLTVLSGLGLLASGLGLIKFGVTEENESTKISKSNLPDILKSKTGLSALGLLLIVALGWGGYKHFTISPEEAKAELKAMNVEFDENGFFHAASTGDVNVMRLFLQAGMHPDYRNQGDVTAMHVAAENKHPEIIELLLKSKAKVDSTLAKENATPLIIASNVGCTKCAELLIAAGANINAQLSATMKTPLMLAASRGHADIVKLLLDKGADIKPVNDMGWNALIYSISESHDDVTKMLLEKGIDANSSDGDGSYALLIAIEKNDATAVKELLQKHANVDVKNKDGQSAIDIATSQADKDMLALLPGGKERISQIEKATKAAAVDGDAPVHEDAAIVLDPAIQASASLEPTASAGSTPSAGTPSFDCAKVSNGPERLICSSRELSAADVKLSQTYQWALSNTLDKGVALKKSQNEWRRNERDVCSDVSCMLRAYQKRIDELGA